MGVNVEVSLSDPAGRQLASLDWWWREGEESLWVSAQSQGEYVLKVSAADEPAAGGKYRVALEKIGELDEATAKERDMVAAHLAYAEGYRLLSQPTPESLRLATGKMQEALSLWRALGDTDAQAHALYELGDISFQAGNLKQAPEYFSQAIPLSQAAGNRYGEANALHSVGDAYSFSGETQKGPDNYNRALTLARAINNHVIEPDVLSGLGLVFQNLGQTPKAMETLEQALSVAHAAGTLAARPPLITTSAWSM
jgi:tetratricopeptide (TPR) repeat protein